LISSPGDKASDLGLFLDQRRYDVVFCHDPPSIFAKIEADYHR
jgi:hypothetical protein